MRTFAVAGVEASLIGAKKGENGVVRQERGDSAKTEVSERSLFQGVA